MDYEALIFDLDGTMWDATENIRKSWNIAIHKFPELKDREITSEELQSVMGLTMDNIAKKLFPEFEKEKQVEILDLCCKIENEYLAEHGADLYPKLEETLDALSKKYKLCVVSNSQSGYIEAFLKAHKLGKYFIDTQCWGDNKVHKGENIKFVMDRNEIKTAAYVGDIQGDADAAKLACIDFIYASYGFGEVKEYTYIIDTFEDLLKL